MTTKSKTKPSNNGLWSKKQLADFLGVNPPVPIWLTDSTPRWVPAEIRAWLASRPRGGIAPSWKISKPRRVMR